MIDPQTGLPVVTFVKGPGEAGLDSGTTPGHHSHEANAFGSGTGGI